jgi:SAM-dependent methyltransferase
MELMDLVNRHCPPEPWSEGDNIPWNDPGFSRRMLNEHLSQSHDAASRRFTIIDRQVGWIHSTLLSGQPSRILDLGCGPGFYSERLSHLGHMCYGIDYSPASIEHAVDTTKMEQLDCNYVCQDIRQAEFPTHVDLVMLIYGEFNIFRPSDAAKILDKSWQALDPGGTLLLEPHTYPMVRKLGKRNASWYSSVGGLFSDRSHVVLKENFWDESSHSSTIRYYVLQIETKKVIRYAQSFQGYKDAEYCALLSAHGFGNIELRKGISDRDFHRGLMAIVARKV